MPASSRDQDVSGDWRAGMQYFVKDLATSPVTIRQETNKHVQVMRLKEDDEITLVFDDGIKRLALAWSM